MSNPNFTTEQIDHICYQIGEWYLRWKDNMATGEGRCHRLGFAKEQLKTMICGDGSIQEDYKCCTIYLYQEPIGWRFRLGIAGIDAIIHSSFEVYPNREECLLAAKIVVSSYEGEKYD